MIAKPAPWKPGINMADPLYDGLVSYWPGWGPDQPSNLVPERPGHTITRNTFLNSIAGLLAWIDHIVRKKR